MKPQIPSMDQWIREAKAQSDAEKIGMYLFHNGVVRSTPRAEVRENTVGLPKVSQMQFSYDSHRVQNAIEDTYALDGIYHVRVWLNSGLLEAGEDIMYVLIGGDIRPHVTAALDYLVGRLKFQCVFEKEIPEGK